MSRKYFPVLMVCLLLLQCQNKTTDLQIRSVEVTDTVHEEAPEPPPPAASCANPVTLEHWLTTVSSMKVTASDEAAFDVWVFGTDSCYQVALADKRGDNLKRGAADLVFHAIKKSGYEGLNFIDAVKKMKQQTEAFSKTAVFADAPLAKATHVSLNFNGFALAVLK